MGNNVVPIRRFRTSDGKHFRVKAEADRHERLLPLAKMLARIEGWQPSFKPTPFYFRQAERVLENWNTLAGVIMTVREGLTAESVDITEEFNR